MIRKVLITGDTHGDFSRFKNYDEDLQQNQYAAIIILGDAGLNWDLNENDSHLKNMLSKKYRFRIYCVRGNHEARPSDVPGMHLVHDDDIDGDVWVQDKWPNICYFKDIGIYYINGYKIGVIGGAYSVDKWYRLSKGYTWFENEQLTKEERAEAIRFFKGQYVDFMLTHTCPISWEPTDLFLHGLDQSKVDKTTEVFLEEIKTNLHFKVWCFGHYHSDRIERPRVEQYYKDTEDMCTIWTRWQNYSATNELDWWLLKSPNFYMGV